MMISLIGKFACWYKKWTGWDRIVSAARELACWYKGKANSSRNGWKGEERAELNIEVISKILDCKDIQFETPADHAKWIKDKIRKEPWLNSHIKITFDNYSKLQYDVGYAHPRLTIVFNRVDFSDVTFFNDEIKLPSFNYSDASTGVEVSFLSCNFIGLINNTSRICWLPDGNSILNFKNCKFISIDFFIGFGISSFSHIILDKCKIINGRTVFMEGDITKMNKPGISTDCKINSLELFELELQLNKQSKANKFPPSVTIKNSKIDDICFIGKINSLFRKGNIFGVLRSDRYTFDTFYWSGYQKFNTVEDDIFSNHSFFLDLNANKVIQNNSFQLLTIQRELARCYHAILRSEGKSSQQDRILFWFSSIASHYGTCWITTVTWLLILNLSVIIPFDFLSCAVDPRDLNKLFDIYFQLLNPIKLPSIIFDVENSGWASFFDVFHKIIYAFLSYELVKTLRRFGKSNSTPTKI